MKGLMAADPDPVYERLFIVNSSHSKEYRE